ENRLRSKAFVTLWETLAHRSEELYLPMQRDAVLLDEDSRLATLSSLFLYRGILDEVRRQEYQCLTKRSVVPKDQAYLLITEAEALLSSPRDFAVVGGR
ncbi:MAG: hypothetical protein RR505_08385, partial [Raoultibacter sp.]